MRRQQGDPNPWGDPPPAPTARAMAVAPIARGETVHIAQYDTEEVVRWIPAIKGARWRDTRAATKKNAEETEQLISFNKPDVAGAAVVGTISRELPQRTGRECSADGLYMEPLVFRSAAFMHFQYDFHLAEGARASSYGWSQEAAGLEELRTPCRLFFRRCANCGGG